MMRADSTNSRFEHHLNAQKEIIDDAGWLAKQPLRTPSKWKERSGSAKKVSRKLFTAESEKDIAQLPSTMKNSLLKISKLEKVDEGKRWTPVLKKFRSLKTSNCQKTENNSRVKFLTAWNTTIITQRAQRAYYHERSKENASASRTVKHSSASEEKLLLRFSIHYKAPI